MKKLIVSMNVTLDGYMSGPECELDWHFRYWNRAMGETLMKELSGTGALLLGRTTYQAMALHWESKMHNLSCSKEEIAFATMLHYHPKVVYSQKLKKPQWYNSKRIDGDLQTVISRLKRSRQAGNKNIMVYGSGKLVNGLITNNLVDEYQLWIHPVVLGKGKPLFPALRDKAGLQLLNPVTFSSGVVLLQYKVIEAFSSR